MQTGQNSSAPENSVPQLGQVRWGSVLMALTALQPQFEPKATPRSIEWCESAQRGAWQIVILFHKPLCVAFISLPDSPGHVSVNLKPCDFTRSQLRVPDRVNGTVTYTERAETPHGPWSGQIYVYRRGEFFCQGPRI
jgi:hypothetical protein